jgi:predicted ester cyclase
VVAPGPGTLVAHPLTVEATMTTSLPGHETALLAAVARWNAGDLDGYLEIYDEDIRLHGYSPEPMDKAAVRAFYTGIFAAFPGCRLTIDETLTDGDRLCCRYTLTGRHQGEFLGVPGTGTEITLPGITILHFRDGRCVQRWSSADLLGVLGQIGAFPPAG